MGWFRLYDEALDDPKVQRLPAELFKVWINILCLANRGKGLILTISDISFGLRVSNQKAASYVSELCDAGLIDITEDGAFMPHNWFKRQYKSDSSTERVQRHRSTKKTVTCNADETLHETHQNRTEQKQNRTEAETPPRHAWSGRVIKLSPSDYATMRKSYNAIPDFDAELATIDAKFASKPPPNWFITLGSWLNGAHQRAMTSRVQTERAKKRNVQLG